MTSMSISEQIKNSAKITTEAERRKNWEQALANSRIEGFNPDCEYLDDVEKNIVGEISDEDFRQKYINRAMSKSGSK